MPREERKAALGRQETRLSDDGACRGKKRGLLIFWLGNRSFLLDNGPTGREARRGRGEDNNFLTAGGKWYVKEGKRQSVGQCNNLKRRNRGGVNFCCAGLDLVVLRPIPSCNLNEFPNGKRVSVSEKAGGVCWGNEMRERGDKDIGRWLDEELRLLFPCQTAVRKRGGASFPPETESREGKRVRQEKADVGSAETG